MILLLVFACGDQPQSAVAPARGTAAPVAVDAGSGVVFPSSGKPPQKTTRPLAKDALAKLAAIDVASFTRTVRKLDDNFLDLQLERLPVRVSVVIQPCLHCVPMLIDRWRAESDTLRVTIPPDLRDRADTTFEVAPTTIGGAPAIWTYQLAFVADKDSAPLHDHAVTLYFNDGVNQIRAIAAFAGTADSRDSLVKTVGRGDLEGAAATIVDRYTQAWGN